MEARPNSGGPGSRSTEGTSNWIAGLFFVRLATRGWKRISRGALLTFGSFELLCQGLTQSYGDRSVAGQQMRQILERLHDRTKSKFLGNVLRWLSETDRDDLTWIRAKAHRLTAWPELLRAIYLPATLTPEEAACRSELRPQDMQLALLAYAHGRFSHAGDMERFLVVCARRFGKPFRQLVSRADFFLRAGQDFVDRIDELVTGKPIQKKKRRSVHHPFEANHKWQLFVRQSGRTPFMVLQANPGDSFAELKRRHRQSLMAVHPDRNASPMAAERTSVVNLAWEVIVDLQEQGLLEQNQN